MWKLFSGIIYCVLLKCLLSCIKGHKRRFKECSYGSCSWADRINFLRWQLCPDPCGKCNYDQNGNGIQNIYKIAEYFNYIDSRETFIKELSMTNMHDKYYNGLKKKLFKKTGFKSKKLPEI